MNKVLTAVAILATAAVSCTKSPQEEHGHDHGLEPLAFTEYSDSSELFVEFKPLIVGSPTKFAAHLTLLGENFLPLTEGSVTVSLIVGDKGIRQKVDAPSVPGIYRLALTPVVAGTGKLVFDIATGSFADQIVIDSVTVYPDEKSAVDSHKAEVSAGDISYLKEQAWKVEFANQAVRRQPFSDIIKTSGQILSAPGDEILVTAKASGIVMFAGNRSIIGSEVDAGTLLFTITGGGLAEGNIDARYAEAKANYEKALTDYDRASMLVKDNIVSQKDFQDAKLKFENAQTAFNILAKNHSPRGQAATAGMNGFVKNILVHEGQYVEAGTPLATISQNRRLMLQANVSQRYFGRLASITAANFRTTDSNTFLSTRQLNGKVISYGRSAMTNSPFIPITFEMDNAGEMVPGSVAEVFLISHPIPDALLVPVSSLLEEQGLFHVYVQTGGESFQKREVKLGANDGINVQLLSGVREGERVVTKGAMQIKLSQASGTMPAHGHEH